MMWVIYFKNEIGENLSVKFTLLRTKTILMNLGPSSF